MNRAEREGKSRPRLGFRRDGSRSSRPRALRISWATFCERLAFYVGDELAMRAWSYASNDRYQLRRYLLDVSHGTVVAQLRDRVVLP